MPDVFIKVRSEFHFILLETWCRLVRSHFENLDNQKNVLQRQKRTACTR